MWSASHQRLLRATRHSRRLVATTASSTSTVRSSSAFRYCVRDAHAGTTVRFRRQIVCILGRRRRQANTQKPAMRTECVLIHVDPLQRDRLPVMCGKQTQHALQSRTFASQPVKELWRSVGAVCFDVDSTVCEEEGIDVLAEHCGAGAAVKEWTHKAMNGNVKFEDALAARLDIIKPSKDDIKNCLQANPPKLTKGVKELISALHLNNIEVFFVSGGFRLMIEPVAEQVNIPLRNIYANTIYFDDEGKFAGFDNTELTSRDGGKAEAIKIIKKTHGHEVIAMVGDGVTDLQARPPADLFIGFGGIVTRDVVKQNADWFVTDFTELTNQLLQLKN